MTKSWRDIDTGSPLGAFLEPMSRPGGPAPVIGDFMDCVGYAAFDFGAEATRGALIPFIDALLDAAVLGYEAGRAEASKKSQTP